MRSTKFFACALVLLLSSSPVLALPRGPLRCMGGFAGPYPCRAVDQASHFPLSDLSNAQSEAVRVVLGWTDEASGRELAVVSLRTRISFVEVTDPENPEVIGDLRGDALGSMAIYRDHLYAVLGVADAKLEIFDLSHVLSAPDPPVRFVADASYDLRLSGRLSINEETGFAYVVSGGGPFTPGLMVALDLNDDLEAPEEVFAWNLGPAPRSLECVLYHGADSRFAGHEICFGATAPRSMVVYDFSDKENPVRLSRAFYKPFNNPWHLALTTDHRFLLLADSHDEHLPGGNTRTFLFDLSSLTAPVHFMTYQGPARARDLHLEVRGRFAFLANARAGLRVLDLRQIAKGRVREVGFFDVEPEKNSSDWFGAASLDVLPSGTVIVGSVRQGLYVLKPRLPS
ncbi:MAG TPA: choice-of-anchor B family protein [Thermoanaerobaculia bacterium]|nr:choice-of-anchor B family protein [Thermoanaerobaculia bacterium]